MLLHQVKALKSIDKPETWMEKLQIATMTQFKKLEFAKLNKSKKMK